MLKKGCLLILIWIFFGGFIVVGVGLLLALVDMLLPFIAVAVLAFVIWKLFFSSNTSTQKSERPKRNSRRRHNKRH